MEQAMYSVPSNKSPSNKESDSKNQHEVRKLKIPKNISARIDKASHISQRSIELWGSTINRGCFKGR